MKSMTCISSIIALGMCSLILSCGSKSSSSKKSKKLVDTTEISNLASAFPSDLAIAAFPQTAASGALAFGIDSEDPEAKKNIDDKVDEAKKIMAGEVDRCIEPGIFRGSNTHSTVSCYEFDSDMNPSRFAGNNNDFGTTDGTDGAGEACMVTFARNEMDTLVKRVDQALALAKGMICQAKKDGDKADLPANAGEELDLASVMTKALPSFMTVTQAKISRLADIGGLPVYRTDLSVSQTTDPAGNTVNRNFEIHIVHSPGSDDTSKGNIWMKLTGLNGQPPGGQGMDPNNTANKNDVMSINYSKEADGSDKKLRLEARFAQIVNTVEPFTNDGLVNYAAVSESATNNDISAIKYVSFDVNPATNEGKLSYWMNPGGSYGEAARGFLFNIDATSDGTLSGCGVSGAAANVSIRKSIAEPTTAILKPTKYWHPRENQNIHPNKNATDYPQNEGNAITKQCFKQNANTGIYEIDVASINNSARGYIVIPQAQAGVEPPTRPAVKLEGSFKP